MNTDNKNNLNKRIEEVLKNKTTNLENAYTKSLEELVEDLNIYQHELEFQNDELKRIQLELEQTKTGYIRLFENAPIGYVIIGLEMDLIDCNQTFKKLLTDNSSERECRKKMDFREFIAASDQDKFHLFHAQLLKSKDFAKTELELISAHNGATHVEILGRFVQDESEPRILLSIKDITEQIEAEKLLRESEAKLRELNLTKDKFFSIIAHDLKNPFSAVLGFSQLLEEKTRGYDHGEISNYAGIIANSSRRIMDLLTNLLEWSHVQTGRISYERKHFDLALLINECLVLFDDNAKQKSITIHKDFPEEIHAFADKSMISTVLRNLISNAIKYTREGGQVTISTRQTPREIGVSVNDTGIGIDPNRLNTLFRIDSSQSTPGTNKEQGSGLGLILSKEFIEKHEGQISAESISGTGSTFHFTLPLPD